MVESARVFVECLPRISRVFAAFDRLDEQLPAQFAGPTVEDRDDLCYCGIIEISCGTRPVPGWQLGQGIQGGFEKRQATGA